MDKSRQRDVARGLRSGDPHAWHALYEEYVQRVWRSVARLTSEEADVADIVQETMLAAARGAAGYDPQRGTLWQWLWGIAAKQAALHHRRRVRQPVTAEGPWQDAATDGPEAALESAELSEQVRTALRELPSDYSSLLMAKYLDGASLADLAERHGSTPAAVSSKLARARRAFADRFRHGGGNEVWELPT